MVKHHQLSTQHIKYIIISTNPLHASIAGITPLTSCNCERGFSLMNLVKKYLSNRMGNTLLSDIMRIKDSEQEWGYESYLDKSLEITKLFEQMKDRKGPYGK